MKKFEDPIENAKNGFLAGWRDGVAPDRSRKFVFLILLALALVPLALVLLAS